MSAIFDLLNVFQ